MVSKLKYGNTNSFFIRGIAGNLLIDTDYAGTLHRFYRAIGPLDFCETTCYVQRSIA